MCLQRPIGGQVGGVFPASFALALHYSLPRKALYFYSGAAHHRRRPSDTTVAAKNRAMSDRKYTTSRVSTSPRPIES